MKLRLLEYFTMLAEELHFGRAAARLSITQPPLSTAIKSLEADLGVRLFERDKTRVELTPAGAAFLTEARKLLQGVERARTVARSVEAGMVGRLDIGFAATLLFRDILKIVEKFRQESPAIEVAMHEMLSNEQCEQLDRQQLDAGFSHGVARFDSLAAISLKADRYALCVHETHPRAHDASVRLRDLGDEPFVMFERDLNPVNHDTLISMFTAAGVHPKFSYQTRSWLTTVSVVSEGCGMAVVPASLARMRMAAVRFIPLAGPAVAVPGVLAWNPASVTPVLGKFLESAARTLSAQARRGQRPHS
jgi:DNA-binding transcriptional LysR family regulator